HATGRAAGAHPDRRGPCPLPWCRALDPPSLASTPLARRARRPSGAPHDSMTNRNSHHRVTTPLPCADPFAPAAAPATTTPHHRVSVAPPPLQPPPTRRYRTRRGTHPPSS